MTAFMSNPIQTMNLQLQTLHELRYGADKKAALKKLGRQILVNHLIVPTLMLFTTDMLRHGFNLADWWDEVEFEDYLLAWMLGSFESLFLVGKITGNIGSFLLDLLNERKASWQSISALPLIDDAARDVRVLDKILFGDDALTEKDLLNGVRAIGDFGMLAGTADHRAGAAGAVLHAIGTQGRRILNWFDDDKR